MIRPFKIPIWVLGLIIATLCAGELAARTSALFVLAMASTLACIGITYNLLGGIATFSGIIFAEFALRTIVISQFGKVLFFEAADKNLEAPQETIWAYFLFYFSLMLGVFVYGRFRVNWIKPLEPETRAQSNIIYFISLVVGLIANIAYQSTVVYGASFEEQKYGAMRSLGLIFSALLLFSLVIAIDSRIRETDGKHSFSFAAFIPWISSAIFGFLNTSRGGIIIPSIIYCTTCYLRGYKFRLKHYACITLGIVIFVLYISPFELYSRELVTDSSLGDRVYRVFYLLKNVPERATMLQATQRAEQGNGARDAYYNTSGTFILSRFAMIRPDSNLIAACSSGYRYGWTSIKIDLQAATPRFLYKNKVNSNSAAFTGRVSGMNADTVENGESAISPISDAYGGFGWMGVIALGLILFPVTYMVYDSTFDISKPWGTVVLGTVMANMGEGGAGAYIAALIRNPIYIVLLSSLIGLLVSLMPVQGDRYFSLSTERFRRGL